MHGGAEANVLHYAEKFAGSATYPVYYIKTADGSTLTGSEWEAGGAIGTANGYTTVKMTAWPFYLAPGETATLTLTSSGEANVANITEVAMTRRANANGAEMGWTNLIGNGGSVITNPTQPSTGNQNPGGNDNPQTTVPSTSGQALIRIGRIVEVTM